MTVRVGINGFGRIGRSVFRILVNHPEMEVVAVNDLFDNAHLAYLLKYDTVMRVFEHEVSADAEAMWVDGRKILMTAEKDPARITWESWGSRSWVSRRAHFTPARSSRRTSRPARSGSPDGAAERRDDG